MRQGRRGKDHAMKSESVGRTGIRFVISCMHRRLDDAGHKSPAQPTTRARQTGRNLLSSSRHAIRYACFCAIRPENARMLACEAFEGQRTSSGFAARCSLRVDRIGERIFPLSDFTKKLDSISGPNTPRCSVFARGGMYMWSYIRDQP